MNIITNLKLKKILLYIVVLRINFPILMQNVILIFREFLIAGSNFSEY